MVRFVADLFGEMGWLLSSKRRQAVDLNLRYLAPGLKASARRRMGRATFRNLARCVLDVLAISRRGRNGILDLIDISGLEHLDRARAAGRGVIVVTPHLGNWELGGIALAALGHQTAAIVEAIGPLRDRIVGRYRQVTGLQLIPHTRFAPRAALRVLERGGMVAVVSDRAIGVAPRQVVPFAASRRAVPVGPAWLALRSGAPVIPVRIVLSPNGPRPYRAVFESPVSMDDLGADVVAELTLRIASRLSRAVVECPDQWFVFQPDWQDALA